MRIKGIKRGKIIELLEEINIPDGQEIFIRIQEHEIITPLVPVQRDEYNQLVAGRSGLWKAIEEFRQEVDLEKVGIEPEIFEGVRDSLPGREVVW